MAVSIVAACAAITPLVKDLSIRIPEGTLSASKLEKILSMTERIEGVCCAYNLFVYVNNTHNVKIMRVKVFIEEGLQLRF